jgi:hypothetical protein
MALKNKMKNLGLVSRTNMWTWHFCLFWVKNDIKKIKSNTTNVANFMLFMNINSKI